MPVRYNDYIIISKREKTHFNPFITLLSGPLITVDVFGYGTCKSCANIIPSIIEIFT